MAHWRWRTAGAALLALTVAIESLQAALGNGRDAALGDVVANTLGGLLGWGLVQLGGRRWPAVALAAAPIGVGLFIAQLIATASLAGPAPDGPEPWRTRLRPQVTGRPTYRGEVTAFTLGGRNILIGSTPQRHPGDQTAREVRARFAWEDSPSATLTPIARLDDAHGWAIAAIDRRGQHLGITLRTVAGRLRFRTPTWIVAVPPGMRTGDMLDLSLRLEAGRALVAAASGAGATHTLAVRYGAQHGWAMINPFVRGHDSLVVWQRWTLAWLLGWGVILGLATMPARRPAVWLGAALGAFVAITARFGARATPSELLCLLLGWFLVRVTGSWFRRPRDVA